MAAKRKKPTMAPMSTRFAKGYKIDPITECWIWVKSRTPFGYGRITRDGLIIRAHRASWILYFGEPPPGLCVCHKCDVPACVNPAHLFLGTRAENTYDRDRKGRGPVGERNWCTKLTAKDIPVIRELHSVGATQKELAAKFGVNPGTISCVVNKTTWTHI